MLTKNQIKYLLALREKKIRIQEGLFIAEGGKVVDELFQSPLRIHTIYAKAEWLSTNMERLQKGKVEYFEISDADLKKVSSLSTPNEVLAVAEIPGNKFDKNFSEIILVLDTIQDPGNLGTIIRIAEWFGISTIISSPNSADAFGSKVVQSAMGSLFRTKLFVFDLCEFLEAIPADIPVYGAVLDGKNIYNEKLRSSGIIILGNESKGISKDVRKFITDPLYIPSFSRNIDSLNVGVAAGIICSEFRRQGW